MLTRRSLSPILCASLLALAACDKEETLGEVDTESTSDSQGSSDSEETSGTTEGGSDSDAETGGGCPADAMICPDGTAVGRSGPDCTFDPCPGDTDGGSDSASTTGDPPVSCPPDLGYQEPSACPDEDGLPDYVIDPGCYAECDPGDPSICGDEICMPLEINPCICANDGTDCCGACSAETALCVPVSSGADCDAIVGMRFESVEELECGLSKDGEVLCHWSIDFSDEGDYQWTYSDIGEGGHYACKDGNIAVDNNPSLSIAFDPGSGILTWDGVEYTAAAG